MHIFAKSGALLSLLILLNGCGGGVDHAPAAQRAAAPQRATVGQTAVDYKDVVQKVYLGYFGRPADAAGLAYFQDVFLRIGAPTGVVDLSRAYDTNPALKLTIDSFGTSQESQDLYPGDNASFIAAIYRNLFSREPDAGGQAFWVNLLNTGQMTRARAAVSLMAGAQSTDIDVINKKSAAGAAFTAGLVSPLQKKGYDGLAAALTARTMLANVTLTTDLAAYQATIDSIIAALATTAGNNSYAEVAQIMLNRCAGCHSANPTIPGFNPAPRGIKYDTSTQIHAAAAQIVSVAGNSERMPFGNMTDMTATERAALRSWLELGAP